VKGSCINDRLIFREAPEMRRLRSCAGGVARGICFAQSAHLPAPRRSFLPMGTTIVFSHQRDLLWQGGRAQLFAELPPLPPGSPSRKGHGV
jgi:hypothetical protein